MLNSTQRERLLKNWGAPADSMACNAEVRIYDPASSWECYIYALNPDGEDEIACMIRGHDVEICDWRLSEIPTLYNSEGNPPVVDREFRPRWAAELFKHLNEISK